MTCLLRPTVTTKILLSLEVVGAGVAVPIHEDLDALSAPSVSDDE